MKHDHKIDDEKLYQQFMDELQQGADEYDKIVASRKRRRRNRVMWPLVTAAACVAVFLVLYLQSPVDDKATSQIAKVEKIVEQPQVKQDASQPAKTTAIKEMPKVTRHHVKKNLAKRKIKKKEEMKEETNQQIDLRLPKEEAKAYYASSDQETSVYRSPGEADVYIGRLADYYGIEKVALNGDGRQGSQAVDCVYEFSAEKDVDLFNKLFLMALWYNKDTPGYCLNFSGRQFLFKLKDVHTGLNYLWLAEKEGNSILVYLTHSPVESKLFSKSFLKYRETWMKQHNQSNSQYKN